MKISRGYSPHFSFSSFSSSVGRTEEGIFVWRGFSLPEEPFSERERE